VEFETIEIVNFIHNHDCPFNGIASSTSSGTAFFIVTFIVLCEVQVHIFVDSIMIKGIKNKTGIIHSFEEEIRFKNAWIDLHLNFNNSWCMELLIGVGRRSRIKVGGRID